MALQVIRHKRTAGVQIRVGRGVGQTRFLAFDKHGGEAATLELARQIEAEMWARHRAGHRTKAAPRRTRKGLEDLPGLRLVWRTRGNWSVIYLVGNYTDEEGRARAFCYSVEKHGLRRAVALGLAKRRAGGQTEWTLEQAMKRLQPRFEALLSE